MTLIDIDTDNTASSVIDGERSDGGQ